MHLAMSMYQLAAVVLLTAAYPLGRAWWASRRTSLTHALTWACAAWLAWLSVVLILAVGTTPPVAAEYVAVCLTGCAGVAVLGARRPGVVAWNFVVLGLLVILLLPLAEGFGRLRLSEPRVVFLAAVVAVGFLNYLPTRMAATATLLAAICGAELWSFTTGSIRQDEAPPPWIFTAIGAAPWAALLLVKRAPATSEFDRTWLELRDGFGALWAERTRQQFNRAAANAGLTGRLGWGGLREGSAAEQEQLVSLLHALLKRFGPPDWAL